MSARVIFAVVLVLLSVLFLWKVDASQAAGIPYFDKIAHCGAFFILAFTFHRAFPLPLWAGVLILTLYGLAIEYAQSLMPYRAAEAWDLVADAAGVLGYYATNAVWVKWQQRTATTR